MPNAIMNFGKWLMIKVKSETIKECERSVSPEITVINVFLQLIN